jgi:hypothetical protein
MAMGPATTAETRAAMVGRIVSFIVFGEGVVEGKGRWESCASAGAGYSCTPFPDSGRHSRPLSLAAPSV